MRLLIVENDPCIPLGESDPFAGLPAAVVRELKEELEAPAGIPVPRVRQLTDFSCGPACLLACLRYWRVFTGPEMALAARMGTDPKTGTMIGRMADLAIKFGLDAEVRANMEVGDLINEFTEGATIILEIQAWPAGTSSSDADDGHYVVLCGFDESASIALFMDPVLGDYGYLAFDELREVWRGYDDQGKVVRGLGLVIEGDRPLQEPFDPGAPQHIDIGARVEEAKAIGSANMSGDVRARDHLLSYRWPSTVKYHVRQASTNATRKLEAIAQEAILAVGTAMNGWLAGNLPYAEAQEQTTYAWRKAYERVREVGRQASGLDRMHPDPKVLAEEERWFRSAVREELGYWHLFLEEIRRGGMTEARMQQRFNAYVDALRFMYEASRVYALPNTALLYWMGPKPEDPRQRGRICEGCTYMMELSPFTKTKLPAVPRDGSTPCLTNCRHKIVVRSVLAEDARRRDEALPDRSAMVARLKQIKEEHHGTHRQERAARHARRTRESGRGHVHNPFRGQPLTESELRDLIKAQLARKAKDDEAAARPHDAVGPNGEHGVLGPPHFFRYEPTPPQDKTVAKTDKTGFHGQHDPPGSSLKLGR